MAQTKICRYCGQVLYSDAETCDYCGRYLFKEHDNPDLVCTKCKSPVNTDDNFCQKCGAVFNIPSEPIEPLPVRHNIAEIPYNIIVFFTSIAVSIAATVFFTVGKEINIGQIFVYWGVAFVASEILLYIYFLPSIIAIENNNTNAYFIYVCNLLFGVTVVGWIVALVFAFQTRKPPRV